MEATVKQENSTLIMFYIYWEVDGSDFWPGGTAIQTYNEFHKYFTNGHFVGGADQGDLWAAPTAYEAGVIDLKTGKVMVRNEDGEYLTVDKIISKVIEANN